MRVLLAGLPFDVPSPSCCRFAPEAGMNFQGTDMLAAEARDRLDAKDREIAMLRGALMAIRDRHLGDCPAAVEEVQHAANHIRDLRKIAYDALKGF